MKNNKLFEKDEALSKLPGACKTDADLPPRLQEAVAQVVQLHDAYRPQCAEMCRRIDEQNARVQQLLAATNAVTPEIKEALAEAARLRAECETAMLQHFYEVSRQMPPAQGKRYLVWV